MKKIIFTAILMLTTVTVCYAQDSDNESSAALTDIAQQTVETKQTIMPQPTDNDSPALPTAKRIRTELDNDSRKKRSKSIMPIPVTKENTPPLESMSNSLEQEELTTNQTTSSPASAPDTLSIAPADNENIEYIDDLDNDTAEEIDFIDDLDSEELPDDREPIQDNESNILEDDSFDMLIGLDNDTPPVVPVQKTIPTPEVFDESEIRRLKLALSTGPADVLLLINGDTEEGVIREKTGEIITLETQHGMEVFNREDIEFIEEIPEDERFETLHIIEKLQRYHQQQKLIQWQKQKIELSKKETTATRQQQQLDIITDQHNPDLFSLTGNRLEEILKDFSQFPPDYWRYYHRKSDAFKTLLQLKRLKRYADKDFESIINLYVDAFEYKKKELSEEKGSSLSRQYNDTYKDRFRMAEKRRLTIYNKE